MPVINLPMPVSGRRVLFVMEKKFDFNTFYRGGFEDKMTRREASLILGVRFVPPFLGNADFFSPSADKARIQTAHKKIMIVNHPDRGWILVDDFSENRRFPILGCENQRSERLLGPLSLACCLRPRVACCQWPRLSFLVNDAC
jgi:hypothetical protein